MPAMPTHTHDHTGKSQNYGGGGGGGVPAGLDTQVQWNNGGVFLVGIWRAWIF